MSFCYLTPLNRICILYIQTDITAVFCILLFLITSHGEHLCLHLYVLYCTFFAYAVVNVLRLMLTPVLQRSSEKQLTSFIYNLHIMIGICCT